MATSSLATLSAAPALADERVRTPWSEFWRKFKRQKVAMVAGAFVVVLVIVAIAAPWIVPYDAENYFDYDALNAGPSAATARSTFRLRSSQYVDAACPT